MLKAEAMTLTRIVAFVLVAVAIWGWQQAVFDAWIVRDRVTLSIVGTTDLHGRVFPRDRQGGLELLGGYLRNLRASRAADGGAVLLLDAGDAFQGGIESNLSEGALVVDAYNALGYNALAIGNHEFEFGALDTIIETDAQSDTRGALKAAAARARFPFLAANLIDEVTGRPVEWLNVKPSTTIDIAGLRVGIVGVMTRDGLTKTLAANVEGLFTAALAPTVEAEARQLRLHGADVVIALTHAGGGCERFDDPVGLTSCDGEAEVFRLARELPRGLVDAIVAGHSHGAVAHEVAGVPVIQAYSWGRAFARLDLIVDRDVGVVSKQFFSPQFVCAAVDSDGDCVARGVNAPEYEGAPVEFDESVTRAMQPALEKVNRWRESPLGAVLQASVDRRRDELESPLGNLYADALLASVSAGDVAIGLGSRRGGLRADLPAGPVTRGSLYDTFPFDNRVVSLTWTGSQLRSVLTRVVARSGRGFPGVSGVRVVVTCKGTTPEVEVLRSTGEPIGRAEKLVVVTTDFFAARSSVRDVLRTPMTDLPSAPLVRNVVADWVVKRGRRLSIEGLFEPPRWEMPDGRGCL